MDMFVEKDIDDIIVGIIQSIIDDFKNTGRHILA